MKELSKESLGSAIYDRISQDLVRGKLRPNQKVTIRSLAEALGTSSTPVRDAVQRLLQDEALEQRSMRDVRVPVPALAQYIEIATIRSELEGLAAARAAEMASDKDITALLRLIERNAESMEAGRWNKAAEYNQQFHFALVEIAQMPVMLGILGRLWLRMGPLIAGYYGSAQISPLQRHRAVVAACEARDPAAAGAAMRADIEDGKEGITAYITSFETG
ncbi:GntR family transcriptional regulator [Roseovarius nanhaiticus]|uniref:Transcriptional regulator, GntR family n=1 Tax=Roseovarius nanhaiticus TaxID=573024 RepID=A0A1N7EDT5_9RHOB|nr:GntR family transcriptional regulator [Roseovarius nanhaiticus]SEK76621.1 transcriptional regulator, GntR family [Roseovarius nanhaiticus]SIR86323.1 transcriptional regulator, GntR family [Roseovarius nanhaiticus]